VILRLGGVARERVEAVLGRPVGVLDTGEIRAPGTLASHYAPRARVVPVSADELSAGVEAALAEGVSVGVIGATLDDGRVVALGAPRDGDAYAHDLYRMLRAADAASVDCVFAVLPDGGGIGAAVVDRLRRAAGTVR
jgi:L-threonylcarbamoyladenylate synthase